MTLVGMSPEAIDAASGRLRSQADELHQLGLQVSSLVNEATRAWRGPDVAGFSAAWTGRYRPQLNASVGLLRSMADSLARQAAEQRTASAAGGGAIVATGGLLFADRGGTPSDEPGPSPAPSPGPSPVPPPSSGRDAPAPYGVDWPDDTQHNGFHLGTGEEPTFTWDEGFVYNSQSPTLADYRDWAWWSIQADGAHVLRPDLDDALAMYDHYRGNTGDPAVFDYEEAYNEDASIKTDVDNEIATARASAQAFIDAGHTQFSMTGDPHAEATYPETENWQKTIGAYQMWTTSEVTVDGDTATMTVTVHAYDHYNFNKGQADIATGTPDQVNGRFTEVGFAKPFDTSGTITRTVTWNINDPQTAPDIQAGGENRDPGGEDPVIPRSGS